MRIQKRDFKRGRLSAKLASKLGRPENAVYDQNTNTLWTVFQENRQMMYEEVAVATNNSKTLTFLHSTQEFTACYSMLKEKYCIFRCKYIS